MLKYIVHTDNAAVQTTLHFEEDQEESVGK